MRAGPQPQATDPLSPSSPSAPAAEAWRRLAVLLLLALLYYLVARASLLLAFAHSNATPVWPPSGIAFGAVLLLGYRACPAVLLGAFAANLATFHANGIPLSAGMALASLFIAAGNTLEAACGAWLMRRHTGDSNCNGVGDGYSGGQPLAQLQNIYKFALIALGMCVVSAGIGSATLVASGLIPAAAWPTVVITWWVGDTAGVLLVGPALIAWGRGLLPGAEAAPAAVRRPADLLRAAGMLMLLALLTAGVFGRPFAAQDGLGWLPYIFVPCLAWAAYRYGLRGASLACLLIAGGAVLGTVKGMGPFAVGPLNDALISLESFVALCSVLAMVLCADASERVRMRGGVPGSLAAQWTTLLIGVGLTVLVWHLVAVGTERRASERFDAECADIGQRLARRLALYETGLRGGQALFKAQASPSRAQWRDFTDGLAIGANFPGMLGLGYAAYVAPEGRAALELAMRDDGLPGFRIWSADAGDVGPAAPTVPAVPVTFLEPFTGVNLRASGYDMLSEPVRRAALLQAAQSGQPVMSAKVTLVQDSGQAGRDGQAGFLMYLPVYRKGAPQADTAQRMAALQGFSYSPIRALDLMRDLLAPADAASVQLEIFDGASVDEAARLYSSGGRSAGDDMQYPNPYRRVLQQRLVNHVWTLRVTSLPAFEESVDRQKAHIVLLAGTIISLLFFGVVRALTARQAYATALAQEMTGALRESESSLIVARDQAEAASRAKSEFVANMSHEIRTPLNAVLGMTHLLANTALSADQQKYLEMIRSSGNSLLSILNDVLDFSKIEAGRMELALAPFQLGAVLEAIATIMTVNSGDKDLELALGVEPDVPQALLGDGHRLQQILINLTGNAIKFTEKGHVSVLVERLPGAAAGQAPGAPLVLRFTVRDSGIGMPADRMAQLFAPFSQADASMTRRFGGTGLGLAISRRIATLMGGEISVRSSVGAGSEFTLTVPLAAEPGVAAAPSGAGDGDGDAALRLLLVDDDAISADYLGKTIRGLGWRIDRAGSGAAALELMALPEAPYDAALVDWHMPGMNGLATLQAMRDTPAGAGLPVVLMVSAYGQGRLLHTEGTQTADAVLLKPVTGARLADAVRQAVRRRGSGGGDGDAMAGAQSGPAVLADAVRLDGARILLVEDNPINQLVARSMLEHAGASIDAVDNGRAALDLLRTDAHCYDLVLMDVQMPEMDGFEATTRIRQELLLELPVLAMTAGVMLSEREQCIACGMNDFIAKPIDVEQMLRAIARNLPAARRASAGR